MAHITRENQEVLGSINLININKVIGGAVINNARIIDSLRNSLILIQFPADQHFLRPLPLLTVLRNNFYSMVFQTLQKTSINKRLQKILKFLLNWVPCLHDGC